MIQRKDLLPMAFCIGLVVAVFIGLQFTNLVIASLVGFGAMVLGAVIANQIDTVSAYTKSVTYGIGSGMMIASAFVIIAPKAMSAGSTLVSGIGGAGIALGYIIGYMVHETGHSLSHKETVEDTLFSLKIAQITGHAALAGLLMGVAYGSIPDLSLIFGFGVVAHKFPAGLTTVLADRGDHASLILIPASIVGIVGVGSAFLIPEVSGAVRSALFGISTGLFLHVGVDMTPECVGSDSDDGHGTIVCSTNTDRIRLLSAFSVFFGALVIGSLWLATAS